MEVQLRMRKRAQPKHGSFMLWDYRFARDNGWNCGCWHPTPEAAARCLLERTGRVVKEYLAS